MSSSRRVLVVRQEKERRIKKEAFRAVLILACFSTLIFTAPHILFAAPPGSPYAPGETLNPSCSPGASNCTVEQIYVATTTLNYGIGSTSPLARLTVSATSSLSSFDLFRVEAVPSLGATTTALIVATSGKVGVGTTSPWGQLSLEMTTTNPAFVISNQGSSTPAFYVGGVNQNGFIGIGTTSPSTASDRLALYGGSFFQSVASTTGAYASDQTGMRVVGTTTISGLGGSGIGDIVVYDQHAYLIDIINDKFIIVNVSDPNSPRIVSTTTIDLGTKTEFEVVGHYAYLVTSTGLHIFDISNKASPKLISTTSGVTVSSFHGFDISGQYAYIGSSGATDFSVIDISNPVSPRIVTNEFPFSEGLLRRLVVSGQYVYIVGGQNILEIIDISNPSSPLVVSTTTISATSVSDIEVSGGYAYISNSSSPSLRVVDISNPSSVQQIGSVNLPYGGGVRVRGRYAYVFSTSGMAVVDIASSTNPINVAEMAGDFSLFDIVGRYGYRMSGSANETLNIIDLSGIEVQSATIHSLEAGSLQTKGNALIAGLLKVTGSGLFGGGILSQGPAGFNIATTTSLSNISALTASISDTNNSSIVDIANLSHTSTSTTGATLPAAGIGSGLLFSSADASWYATSTSRIASLLTSVSTSSPTSALTFSNKNTTGSLSEFMRLDSSGRLGIGTTSPYAKLSVVGEVVARNFTATSTTATSTFMGGVGMGTSTPSAPLSVSGNAYFASNVGIGVSNPTRRLHLGDDTSDTTGIIINNDNTNGISAVDFSKSGTTKFRVLYNTSGSPANASIQTEEADPISFATLQTERMRIEGSGIIYVLNNFGIGTTSPYALFSIATTTTPVIPLFVISTSTSGTSTSTPFIVDRYGNTGIGSTSPWRTLSVTGTVAINGLTTNATADAVCILANKEITSAGGAVCNGVSSQRFKHDIQNVDLGLSAILAMRPVTFRYNEGYGDSGKVQQFGLIAEETYQIDPRLAVLDAEGLPTTVRYDFLAPILIKAVQELDFKLTHATTSTSLSNDGVLDFIIFKFSEWGVAITQTFTRITTLFTGTLHVENKLCADDVCITKDQLKALLIQSGGSALDQVTSPSNTSETSSVDEPSPVDTIPPVITLIGNNTAEIEKGTPYLDLGATVTDDVSTNLGVSVTGDHIDTTVVGVSTIIYTATDGAGNTATSTRTVIVKEQGGGSGTEEALSEPVASTTPVVISEVATSTANGE